MREARVSNVAFLRFSDLNCIDVTLSEFATFMCRVYFSTSCNVFHAQTFSESEIPARIQISLVNLQICNITVFNNLEIKENFSATEIRI